MDAGLAIKTVVKEDDSDRADALFQRWAESGTRLITPKFFQVETDSILRQKVALRGLLTADEAEEAFAKLQVLPVQLMEAEGQRLRAWQIASRFSQPTVYDSTYIALAEIRGCEFWTADVKLVKSLGSELSFVKCLSGELPSPRPY